MRPEGTIDDAAIAATRFVAIGGSVEGLPAITRLVGMIPPNTGHAFAVVIDRAGNDGELSERLRGHTAMPVVTANLPVAPKPDHIYVAPPGSDLTIANRLVEPAPPLAASGTRCSIDRLFRSIATEYGPAAVGIVVSGSGADGAIGLKLLKESGGVTIAQLPGESVPDEMTRMAVATGFVDFVLPLSGIALQLTNIDTALSNVGTQSGSPGEVLLEILVLLKVRTGHDFTQYKRSTLFHRVARRMQVNACTSLDDYLTFVRNEPNELAGLLRDFMISVTNFFRDPDAYRVLETTLIPKLFEGPASEPIRVWVAGCASGEEAYSIAMLLLERRTQVDPGRPIQIFATDIDNDALAEARAGRYPNTIAADVRPAHCERFFTRDGDFVQVTQEVREHVLFASHNLLRDAPFSRLDLFSCRNLLIYLERPMQEHVLRTAHFALKPDRYLFLGSSEHADTAEALFDVVDPRNRIFQRRSRVASVVPASVQRWSIPSPIPLRAEVVHVPTTPGEAHYRMVEQYAPPSLLVNARAEISHISERAGRYLKASPGEPSRDLFQLVLPELRLDVRASVYAARRKPGATVSTSARCEIDGATRQVRASVRAEQAIDPVQGSLLVWFEESDIPPEVVVAPSLDRPHIEPVVQQLEDELRHTRDQLRTTIEQYETLVEELHASNEEFQALNEELRSASEEIEAGREETDSVNQELITVNHELKLRVEEVTAARSDIANLMESSDVGVIFMDRDLRIFRFTQGLREIFNVLDADVGRPLTDLTSKINYPQIHDDARRVLDTLVPIEREVKHDNHNSYLVRIRPYRSLDDRIAGVVATFIDITALRRVEDALRNKEAMLELAERAASAGIWELDHDESMRMSEPCHRLYGTRPSASRLPRDEWMHAIREDDRARVLAAIDAAIRSDPSGNLEVEFQVTDREHGERSLWMLGRKTDPRSDLAGITLDVTPAREARRALEQADKRKDEFIATVAHELRNPLTALVMAVDLQSATTEPEHVASARAIISRQIAQLRRLVDDLLDISRIQSGRFELRVEHAIRVADVIATAAEAVGPLVVELGHRLAVDVPPELCVDGDRVRLAQLFTNLLTNAAKYTEHSGDITVTAARGTDTVIISVADTGIGIAPDVLPRVFDVFVQAEPLLTRARGGLGLGLSVAKQIVALHGGTIVAHSGGLRKGSVFTVTLPGFLRKAPT